MVLSDISLSTKKSSDHAYNYNHLNESFMSSDISLCLLYKVVQSSIEQYITCGAVRNFWIYGDRFPVVLFFFFISFRTWAFCVGASNWLVLELWIQRHRSRGVLPIKWRGCSSENFETNRKRYQNLVLWVCPKFISIPKRYQFNNNKL